MQNRTPSDRIAAASLDALPTPATSRTASSQADGALKSSLTVEERSRIEQILRSLEGRPHALEALHPLTAIQEGLLFHHLLDEQRDAYVLSCALEVASREALDALLGALQRLIDRHECFRTAILWRHLTQPVQAVMQTTALPIRHVEWRADQTPSVQLKTWTRPEWQPWDLEHAPLLRVSLAQDPSGPKWYALLQVHHIVCDYRSLRAMAEEIGAEALLHASALVHRAPYSTHVEQALLSAARDEHEAYFRRALADIDAPTAPFGLAPMQGESGAFLEHRESIEGTLAARVRQVAAQESVSVARLIHAAWALVVARISTRDDVVLGTVISPSYKRESLAEQPLGMQANTLPLRINLEGLSARALLAETDQVITALRAHAYGSLQSAQRQSTLEPSAPLFGALLNVRRNAPPLKELWAQVPGVHLLWLDEARTHYPVTLIVDDEEEGFALTTQTDSRVAPARITGYLRTALASLVDALKHHPERPALTLEVLPPAEREQMLEVWSGAGLEFHPRRHLHELFEAQVDRTPEAVAVCFEGASLTYRELDRAANQLAHTLRGKGVGPDVLVGVCLERSLQMLIAIVAVLKADGAYVPLDPAYPPERLQYLIADAAPRVVLTQAALCSRLSASSAELIALDADSAAISAQPVERPIRSSRESSAKELAYVIYTSGSTGTPKGVMIEHAQVVRLFAATQAWFKFSAQDVWTLFHSFAFDFSVWEIWGALLYGGRLVIVPQLTARSPQEFYALLCEERVTVLNQTPSAFAQLTDAQARDPSSPAHALRVVIFGGEALEPRSLKRWVDRNGLTQPQIVNMYGITETTVHVTYHVLTHDDLASERSSVIGRAIPDLRLYLLDRRGQLVPPGVVGELYVGGAGLARGYLRRPELTEARFSTHRLSAQRSSRLYKSGDLGRFREDGTLEYLGRNDDQVKIRGFRIELGEIEAQLLRHASIKDAVVLARREGAAPPRLIAYVIPQPHPVDTAPPSAESLRAHLKSALPDYMVPSAFVLLEHFPLTAHGKLDRRALPAPNAEAFVRAEYTPPENEREALLADVWREMLTVERIGRHDNFFALGGHSLLLVQMIERLRRLGWTVEPRRLLERPILHHLADTLVRIEGSDEPLPPNRIAEGSEHLTPEMLSLVSLSAEQIESIVRAVPGGAANIQDLYPLSPLQEGMWFHHRLGHDTADVYVVPTLLKAQSRAALKRLISALQTVIDRHDVLRTAVLWEHLPHPVQVVYRRAELPVEPLTLDPARDPLEAARAHLHGGHWMDLRAAPLLKLTVAEHPKTHEWLAILQLHHLIGDQASLNVIQSEIATILEGAAHTLPTPPLYRDHIAQLLKRSRERDVEAFFRESLASIDEPTSPFGLLDVRGAGREIEEARERVPSALAFQVRETARRCAVSAASLFHAAWALVVARTSARTDVVLGTVLLGRLHSAAHTAPSVGLFINTLPLRVSLAELTAHTLLESTHRALAQLLEFEHASLAVAQRASGIAGSAPLFTSLLNYRHVTRAREARFDREGMVRVLESLERTNYPVTLSIDDDGVDFTALAQTDRRIDPKRLTRYLCTALTSLIDALNQAPQALATHLEVLPQAERDELIVHLNATQATYPRESLIHELFEAQVRATPKALAVVHGQERLTYEQLNRKANQLAHALRKHGVGADRTVGLYVERGIDMIVAMLGILKAGAAYVALDPHYPESRVQYMLENASPSCIVTQAHLSDRLPRARTRVVLDGPREALSWQPTTPLDSDTVGTRPSHLAYVIYTSGSTGQPKGVAIEHRHAVNLIHWARQALPNDVFQKTLHSTSLNFDLSVYECFVPLSLGGTVHVVANALELAKHALPVTLINTVPSAIKSLLDAGAVPPSVRVVNLAGEALKEDIVRALFATTNVECVCNLYGPSETTTYSTWVEMPRQSGFDSSIGRPIANTQIYLLDGQRQLVPRGVVGEVYIGGDGVARGYLHAPERTAERFLPDPFREDPQARMYKTGDLGRWRENGTLEYLGRNDHQVKVRGFRVELGEIETQLARHADIHAAAVVAREDTPGERRLVAYVVLIDGRSPLSAEALRRHLKGLVPDYMVPSAFVMLERLPLTPNGKLDRAALPAPETLQAAQTLRAAAVPQAAGEAQATTAHATLHGPIEAAIATLWQTHLRLGSVDRNEDFFVLGGHSLNAMQVLSRAQTLFSVELGPETLFEFPTIRTLAAHIESLQAQDLNTRHSARTDPAATALSDEPASRPDRVERSHKEMRP